MQRPAKLAAGLVRRMLRPAVVAVIALTALVRLALLPASAWPVQQSWLLAGLQPQLRANREQWSAEPIRLLRENMRLYRGASGSPVGTLVSVVAQLLTLGVLYLSLRQLFCLPTLSAGAVYQRLSFLSPQDLFSLNFSFLWLNLSGSDPTLLTLPVVVAASTWGVITSVAGSAVQLRYCVVGFLLIASGQVFLLGGGGHGLVSGIPDRVGAVRATVLAEFLLRAIQQLSGDSHGCGLLRTASGFETALVGSDRAYA